MRTATVQEAADQLKDGLIDFSDRVKEISEDVSERWKDTRHDLHRRAKNMRIATEDRLEEARFRIKAHPLRVVATIASGAFLLGVITGGWASSGRRRR